MPVVALGLAFGVTDVNAAPSNAKESLGEIIFKIHDIVPEKNADGNVVYCNIGATFFNRTKNDVANLAISLNWKDDVIGEIMDIEEREEREKKRSKSKEPRSRYSTSSFTSDMVTVDLKLPPIKVNQQITLKTKVDTDRCFILLNDMDVAATNCGTLSNGSSKDSCSNFFQYVSPKSGEYYTDFKEISWENQIVAEDDLIAQIQEEVDGLFDETLKSLDSITDSITAEEKNPVKEVPEKTNTKTTKRKK